MAKKRLGSAITLSIGVSMNYLAKTRLLRACASWLVSKPILSLDKKAKKFKQKQKAGGEKSGCLFYGKKKTWFGHNTFLRSTTLLIFPYWGGEMSFFFLIKKKKFFSPITLSFS